MLKIARQFNITTLVENDEMLSDFLEYRGVDIVSEHVEDMLIDTDNAVTFLTLGCQIEIDKFDELVTGLKELFKDQQAVIAY